MRGGSTSRCWGTATRRARRSWRLTWRSAPRTWRCLYLLGRRLRLSPWPAAAAAAILALYPTFLFVGATYHQVASAVFFFLLIALLAANALHAPRLTWRTGALMGAVSGLGALNRSEMLVIGPVLLVVVAIWRRRPGVFLAGLAALALVMAPWTVRNWEVFHKVIPTAQSNGFNLWKGYNPYTTGSGNQTEQPGGPGRAAWDRIESAVPPGPGYETRVQAAFSRQLHSDVSHAGPGRLFTLLTTKIAMLWAFDWTDTAVTHRFAYLAPWAVTNLLALVGLIALVRRGGWDAATVAVCALMLAMLTAAYALTSVHARYRMHIEPFLFLLAGAGLWAVGLPVLKRVFGWAGPPLVAPPS